MCTNPLDIAVIVGTTRAGRRGPEVAQWVLRSAPDDPRLALRVVDLAAFALPLLDDPTPPAVRAGAYPLPSIRRWAATIARADAFVIVTGEYNRSLPASLKNALDLLHREWHDKALGFVGYGADAGGARAIEHLRGIAGELRLADVRPVVLLSLREDVEDGVLRPRPSKAGDLAVMLHELWRWGTAMRSVRVDARSGAR